MLDKGEGNSPYDTPQQVALPPLIAERSGAAMRAVASLDMQIAQLQIQRNAHHGRALGLVEGFCILSQFQTEKVQIAPDGKSIIIQP